MSPSIYILDFIVVSALLVAAARRGVEAALPVFAFLTILIPISNMIKISGVLGITTQRLAIMVLVLCYLLFGNKGTEEEKAVPLPLKVLIILQIIWSIISTVNSIDPVASGKKMISEVVEYYLLYLIFFKSIHSVKTIQRILTAMVLAMVVASFFGAIESYSNWQASDLFPTYDSRFIATSIAGEESGRGSRVESTFPHPILFAAAITTVLPIALYLTSLAKTSSRKIFLWLGICLMFLCLYKTQSRGPWMASILSFALLVPWGGVRIRKYMLMIGFLCVALMIVRPGVYDTIDGMYQATMDPKSPMGSSYQYRYALKDVAMKALAKDSGRSLWGYGMETFFDLHLSGPFLDRQDHPFLSCDSAWIEMMVETGYVGLGLFALILFSAAFQIYRARDKLNEEYRSLAWIFFVCMFSYYFMMTSVAMYAWGQNGYMLWMIIAMSYALVKVSKTDESVDRIQTPSAEQLSRRLVNRREVVARAMN